ncbi:unnamed protein product, partial [Polarella glacialis]
METLRGLWSSASYGGYPEGSATLQVIGDTIRDHAQQLLGSATGSSDGPVQRRGKVYGDHRFQFALHFEPRSEHGGLCQTGVLVASATTFDGRTIPLKCQWKRQVGAHLIEISGINTNMYHTSADDIGMHIACTAEPEGDWGLGQ